MIYWKIVAAVGLASAIAPWFGTDLMRTLSNQTLTRIFGVVLVLFGARMLIRDRDRNLYHKPSLPSCEE